MNNFNGVGRLTKDPVISGEGDKKVARFTLAINRNFKNKDGEYDADFINVVAFRNQANVIDNFVKKGHQLGIEGRIQTGSYEKDNARIYTTDVVANVVHLLEPRNSQGGQSAGSSQANPSKTPANNASQESQSSDPFAGGSGPIEVSDDDLPF